MVSTQALYTKKKGCEAALGATLSPRWPNLGTWITAWNAFLTEKETVQEAFEQLFSIEFGAAREKLASIVHDATFQEALLLSNPNMYTAALPSYFRHYCLQHRPAKIRHLERRFYSYLQRFCMKNDTTSFFGPIDYGWYAPEVRKSSSFWTLPFPRLFLIHCSGYTLKLSNCPLSARLACIGCISLSILAQRSGCFLKVPWQRKAQYSSS